MAISLGILTVLTQHFQTNPNQSVETGFSPAMDRGIFSEFFGRGSVESMLSAGSRDVRDPGRGALEDFLMGELPNICHG